MPPADESRDDVTSPYSHGAVARARGLLEETPERIGRYRVLERLGHGGMGEVYRVEQRDEIRRELALKLIKLGMDTKQVVARFEAERQALALMDHPHIARVFDAGADDSGRPYFVMELVRGVPITQYADEQRLSIDQRLRLFLQVCSAVQHAHQKGIIHRDLKPSNVLVSTQDGKPHAKVIDFGIAKATAGRLTDKTLYTEFANFIGTPQYMSPEQAAGSLDIDTRSDVYSLGVLLYELVSGHSPFDADTLRNAALAEIARILREVDPPRPSTRLTTSAPQEPKAPARLSQLAAERSTEPASLVRQVTGEIDWLVMKALEKDRSRRYASPADFAEDIERRLAGLPVEAAPPSLWYRARKLIRRHKAPAIAAAVVLLTVTGAFASIVTFAWQSQRSAELALAAESKAKSAARREADQRVETEKQRERLAQSIADNALATYKVGLLNAHHAYQRGDTEATLELLDSCPKEYRGWEWHSMRAAADMSLSELKFPEGRTYVGSSPDGRYVLLSCTAKSSSLLLYDVVSNAEVGEINLPAYEGVENADMSNNADTVVITYQPRDREEYRIAIWRRSSGSIIRTVTDGVNDGLRVARYSPPSISRDGKRLVCYCLSQEGSRHRGGLFSQWKYSDTALLLSGSNFETVSAHGDYTITQLLANHDFEVRDYCPNSFPGEPRDRIDFIEEDGSAVTIPGAKDYLAASSDGKAFYLATQGGDIVCFDVDTGECPVVITSSQLGDKRLVLKESKQLFATVHDNRYLVGPSKDRSLLFISLQDSVGFPFVELHGLRGTIERVCTDDSHGIVRVMSKHQVHTFPLPSPALLDRVRMPLQMEEPVGSDGVYQATYHSGPILDSDEVIRRSPLIIFSALRDGRTGEVVARILGEEDDVYESVVSPSGRHAARVDREGLLVAYHRTSDWGNIDASQSRICEIQLPSPDSFGRSFQVLYGPDETRIVVGGDRAVAFADLEKQVVVARFPVDGSLVAYTDVYVYAKKGGVIRGWRIADPDAPPDCLTDGVDQYALANDGKRLATRSGRIVSVWSLDTHKLLGEWCVSKDGNCDITWRDDDTRVVLTQEISGDGWMSISDPIACQELLHFDYSQDDEAVRSLWFRRKFGMTIESEASATLRAAWPEIQRADKTATLVEEDADRWVEEQHSKGSLPAALKALGARDILGRQEAVRFVRGMLRVSRDVQVLKSVLAELMQQGIKETELAEVFLCDGRTHRRYAATNLLSSKEIWALLDTSKGGDLAYERLTTEEDCDLEGLVVVMGDYSLHTLHQDGWALIRAAANLRLNRYADAFADLDSIDLSDLSGSYQMRVPCLKALALHFLGRSDEARVQLRMGLRYWEKEAKSPLQREAISAIAPEWSTKPERRPSLAYQAAEGIPAVNLNEIVRHEGEIIAVEGYVTRISPTVDYGIGAQVFLDEPPLGFYAWLRFNHEAGLTPELLDAIEHREIVVTGKVARYHDAARAGQEWGEWEIVPASAEDIRILEPSPAAESTPALGHD